MTLFSILASVAVAASSISPRAISVTAEGELLLCVELARTDGSTAYQTFSLSTADWSAAPTQKTLEVADKALPEGLSVPAKLDSMVCSPFRWTLPDGRQRMAIPGFRTGFLYWAESSDGGKSWETPHRMMHNPDKPFGMCATPGGGVMLVKNCRIDEVEFTRDDELYACWSHDNSESWYRTLRIADEKFCDCPVCCADSQGKFYIAYRHIYQRICEVKVICIGADYKPIGPAVTVLTADQAEEAYLNKYGHLLQKRSDWLQDSLKIVSYNTLRSAWSGGQDAWRPRCATICEHIAQWDPDFVGMQETSMDDVADLGRKLRKNYDFIAITPEIMGPEVSEFRQTSEIPLWWRKSRFKLLEKGWLEFNIINPIKCGVNLSDESWGNAADGNKAALWGIFQDLKTGCELCVFNVHFPTRTEPSKLGTAKMVAEKIAEVAGGRPVFIIGDYNMDYSSFTYQYLENDVEYIRDAGAALPEEKRKNFEFDAGGGNVPMEKKSRKSRHVDHVFYTPATVEPLRWELNPNLGSNGSYGSDHHPILVVFRYSR